MLLGLSLSSFTGIFTTFHKNNEASKNSYRKNLANTIAKYYLSMETKKGFFRDLLDS